METAIIIIRDIGFPCFVALFVLIRLEPAIKDLKQSIITLMVVTAKANGMSKKTVEEVVTHVMAKRSGKRRRVTDVLDDDSEKACR